MTEQAKYFHADGTECLIDMVEPETELVPFSSCVHEEKAHPAYALALLLGSMLLGAVTIISCGWIVFG